MNKQTRIFVPISVGELIDKVTILSIKMQKLSDIKKTSVRKELIELESPMKKILNEFPIIKELARDLMLVNSSLWDLENQRADLISTFGSLEEIGAIAKRIAMLNYDRHSIKADINRITKSEIVEEKSYGIMYED